ncbi:hypothetical protein ANAEL_04855 [Anaerolineales bacterium]|nr:hypothetical protein ANAEL_04855 [Anaerolineales bacterium]
MNSLNKTARMAGFLYLIYMIITIPADALARSPLIMFGDAATTARNIMASEWQFRVGITGDLVSAVFFLLAAWALYALLKPVNKDMSLLFLLLNLGGVSVYFINLLNQFAAVLLLSGVDYLKVFQADQLQSLAMFFLDLHHNGYWIAQIFFGAWLFPLGYLVYKSGFLPKILGVVMMIHFVGWTTTSLLYFLYTPGYTALTYVTYPLGFISEFGLMLWLLVMGAKEQKPS